MGSDIPFVKGQPWSQLPQCQESLFFVCPFSPAVSLTSTQVHNALSPQHSTTVAPKAPSLCCPAMAVPPHSSFSQPTLPITTAPTLSVHKKAKFLSLPHEVWLQILHLPDSKRMNLMPVRYKVPFLQENNRTKAKKEWANSALISCWVLLKWSTLIFPKNMNHYWL